MHFFRTLAISLVIFGIAEVYAKESVDKPSETKSSVASENVSQPSKPSKPSKPRVLGQRSTIYEEWVPPPPGYTTRSPYHSIVPPYNGRVPPYNGRVPPYNEGEPSYGARIPYNSRRNVPVRIWTESNTMGSSSEGEDSPDEAREPSPETERPPQRERPTGRQRQRQRQRQQEPRNGGQGGSRDRSRSPRRN